MGRKAASREKRKVNLSSRIRAPGVCADVIHTRSIRIQTATTSTRFRLACITEISNVYRILVRRLDERRHLEDLGVDRWTVLQEVLGRTIPSIRHRPHRKRKRDPQTTRWSHKSPNKNLGEGIHRQTETHRLLRTHAAR
jgi:hypothetical protein